MALTNRLEARKQVLAHIAAHANQEQINAAIAALPAGSESKEYLQGIAAAAQQKDSMRLSS